MNGCDQCQVVTIQGVACHETGCPKSWRDPVTGKGYPRECDWCGCEFVPDGRTCTLCSVDCYDAYFGLDTSDGPDPVADADLLCPEPEGGVS